MIRLLILLIALILPGSMGWAGAWQRDKGAGFSSASVRLSWPQNLNHWTSAAPTAQYYTLYTEYGLTPKVTLGFDLGRSVSGASKSIAFVQLPIRQTGKGPVMSGQLGFGQISGKSVLRPGLSIGRGLKNGWLTLDTIAEYHIGNGETDVKLDMTWSRNLDNGRKFMVQLQTGDTADDPPFARLAPSYVIPFRDRFHLETGVTWGLVGDTSMGLKMGVWMDF